MANPLYTLDFSPMQSGIEYYRQAADKVDRQAKYQNALAQAGGLVDQRMMPVLGSMDAEQGPSALFSVYNAGQQRDMMMAHHRAQEAQARANQAHANATLAETRRYHDASIGLARDRMNMLDSRVRDRYGLGAEEGGGARPMSDDGVGIDPQGGFYIRPRATPISAPRPSGPSIGATGQGRAPLPVDRIEEQGSFMPTSGETPMPGVSVGAARPDWMHPGGAALARERAQKLLDDGTDMTRLDPRNPKHSLVIQELGAAYGGGKLEKGKRWSLDSEHRLVQEDIPGATKLTANERKGEAMAVMGLRALDQAERQLVGKVGKKDDEYIAEGNPGIPGWKQMAQGPINLPVVGNVTEGFGDTLRALKSARSAVTALNFYMSGAGVSNQEREHFLDLYMPKTMDSRDTQAWKIGRLKDYFKIVRSVRDGVPGGDAAIQEATRSAIQEGAERERGSRKQEYSPAESTLQEARDAIAKGAPREQVWKRLKQNGIDPGKL